MNKIIKKVAGYFKSVKSKIAQTVSLWKSSYYSALGTAMILMSQPARADKVGGWLTTGTNWIKLAAVLVLAIFVVAGLVFIYKGVTALMGSNPQQQLTKGQAAMFIIGGIVLTSIGAIVAVIQGDMGISVSGTQKSVFQQ